MRNLFISAMLVCFVLGVSGPAAAEHLCDKLMGPFEDTCSKQHEGNACKVMCSPTDATLGGISQPVMNLVFPLENGMCQVVYSNTSYAVQCAAPLKMNSEGNLRPE